MVVQTFNAVSGKAYKSFVLSDFGCAQYLSRRCWISDAIHPNIQGNEKKWEGIEPPHSINIFSLLIQILCLCYCPMILT